MKKCLVLGAGGFIGKNLCARLIDEYDVRAIDKFNIQQLQKIGVKDIVEGDFLEKDDFYDVLEGMDTVFHLISTTLPKAGTAHIIEEEIGKNVLPTIRLLESMKKMGTKSIVFASSGGTIYGDYSEHPNKETDALNPKCSYALQKQLIEDCMNFYRVECGIRTRIARISNPYGVGQSATRMQGVIPIFIDHLLKDEPITVLGANSRRNYIYMDDVTDALVALGTYEGDASVFNIGSRDVCTLNEVVKIIEDVAGKEFSQIHYQEQRSFDVTHAILDTSFAKEELNWEAKTTIRQGIERLYIRIKDCTR